MLPAGTFCPAIRNKMIEQLTFGSEKTALAGMVVVERLSMVIQKIRQARMQKRRSG